MDRYSAACRTQPASETAPTPMEDQASPATSLRDVLVTNDQTRASWNAGTATIRRGHIVITEDDDAPPPDGFFAAPHCTYTITAEDGGQRRRLFRDLKAQTPHIFA